MWDQYDWISCEDLILPSVQETYTGSVNFKSSTSRHGDKRTSDTPSFPKYRTKMKALLFGDRSQPSGREESEPPNSEHSIASQRMPNDANFSNPPSYPKSEVNRNRYASPAGRSGRTLASKTALDTHSDIHTSNYLSDAQPIFNKRNSMLQKVVRGVSSSKEAVARRVFIQSGTATPQPIQGMMLLKKERKRPEFFLPSAHTRHPTASRIPFELTSNSNLQTALISKKD